MLAARHEHALFAYELEARQAQRILEQALRAGARVTLTPGTENPTPLQGVLVSATAESLWIEVRQPRIELDAGLQSVCCEGVFELGDTRYLLASNVLAVVSDGEDRRLEIVRPEGLQVLQRRRFWRAQVQDSSPVLVSRPAADGQAPWSCLASMLNVSVDGLACLAERSEADATAVGEQLRLVVRVCPAEEPFVVDAVLKSKTAAGTEGQIVLGFQFDLTREPDQRQRLHAALERLA